VSATAEAPAGFWRRYAAWSLDWLLLALPLSLVLFPLLARAWRQWQAFHSMLDDWVYQRLVASGGMPDVMAMTQQLLHDDKTGAPLRAALEKMQGTLALATLAVLGAGALWFIGFEASAWQATPGKRFARVRVAAADGSRLSSPRVALRHFAGALSWLLLNLGHAIAGWRDDHRALHDLVAGAQLRAQGPMPRWARAWLLLQLSLTLALILGMAGWIAWSLWQIASI
jgi:uncharacterized RDD family membrane protein YckC